MTSKLITPPKNDPSIPHVLRKPKHSPFLFFGDKSPTSASLGVACSPLPMRLKRRDVKTPIALVASAVIGREKEQHR